MAHDMLNISGVETVTVNKISKCVVMILSCGVMVQSSSATLPSSPDAQSACQVIYETFNEEFPPSNEDPFHPVNIWFAGEHTGTFRFIPDRDYKLCEIIQTTQHSSGENGFNLIIYEDENNLPSNNIIGSWEISFPSGKGEVEPTSLDVSGENITLKEGETYWIGNRVKVFPSIGNIHHSTIPNVEAVRAEFILHMGGWVRVVEQLGWDSNPGSWRIMGELVGGVECTGREKIAKAKCKKKRGKNILTVKLTKSTPTDAFSAKLDDGTEIFGVINQRGKSKARFDNLESGEGNVTVKWDCGARSEKSYECP